MRTLLTLAAMRRFEVRFFHISWAFLHTPIREKLYLEPPREYREYCLGNLHADPGDVVWLLHCTIYRLNVTMVDFDTHYAEVSSTKLGMARLVAEPSVSTIEGPVIVTKHVDDGMVIGDGKAVMQFLADLSEHFLLKVSPILAAGGKQ